MQEINLSERQYETLNSFFSGNYDEILYWGWARWGKSYLIWVICAICIAAFPWSSWLIARTVLSDLHSTTLATFFQVLRQLGFWPKSYKDKIKDKKHIEFHNGSKVYVIQVNNEPSDPEFDRLGSHSLTWSFLDEAQQMVSKVRSVLAWRYSETSADFEFAIDYKPWQELDEDSLGYSMKIAIIWEASFNKDELDKSKFIKIKKDWKYWLWITRYENFFIPYNIIDKRVEWDKLIYQCVWKFVPCSLLSCNPWKNFTYTDFYKPYSKWELPENKKFIRALVTDNPFVEFDYVKRLERSWDEITKQRLLYGNFEYDDDPTLLFTTFQIDNMFQWPFNLGWIKFMTVDAARMWKDKTVIMIWDWFTIIDILQIDKWPLTETKKRILELKSKHNIALENIIIDEVWVWGWLVDEVGSKGFIANASPINPISSKLLSYKKRNYANLRTQCFFYLQRLTWEGKIKIMPQQFKEVILEELGFIKQDKIDDDKKISLQSKKDMWALLWRSPDFADAISFRMFWVVKQIAEDWYEKIDEIVSEWDEITSKIDVESLINEFEAELEAKNSELYDYEYEIY